MERVLCAGVGLTALLLAGMAVFASVQPSPYGDAETYLRQANREGFRRAAKVSPMSAAPWMGLGLLEEQEGNSTQAEADLTRALALDRGYLPRWTLANLYLRHEDLKAWPLLAEALRIALHGGQPTAALFEMCWNFRPDAEFLQREVVGSAPEALRSYLAFLLETNRSNALSAPAMLLAGHAQKADNELLLRVSDRLLSAKNAADARSIWDRITPPEPSGELLTNTRFQDVRQLGFDWHYNSIPESRIVFDSFARFDLTGLQPDPLELVFETVLLKPGTYVFSWEAKQSPPQAPAGFFWQATDSRSGAELFQHAVQSAADWREDRKQFVVAAATLVRFALHTGRTPGYSRFEGTVWLQHPSLKPQ